MLDYIFHSHKSQINSKNNLKLKDYIFDLVNTFQLNIDLLENMTKEFFPRNPNLLIQIQHIKKYFENKRNLRLEKASIKGKLLIEKQIVEENILEYVFRIL